MGKPKKPPSRYRKIEPRMWADEKFRALSKPRPNAQTLWIYLLTGPHTTAVPGLSCIGKAELSDKIGWPQSAMLQCFREISDLGMVKADWDALVLWVPNAVKRNEPNSPNVVLSWGEVIEEIPGCQLRDEAMVCLEAFTSSMGEAFVEAFNKTYLKAYGKPFAKPFAKPYPNQEQEQEQEQDISPEGEASEANGAAGTADDPAVRSAARVAFELWSQTVRGHGLKSHENEERKVLDLVTALSQEPPIIHGAAPVGQHLLVPRACECLRLKTPPTPMKSVAFGCACVRNLLGEWSRDGMPGTTPKKKDQGPKFHREDN